MPQKCVLTYILKYVLLFGLFLLATEPTSIVGGELLPVVPIGLDAYRMWDRWPYQRIGCRAFMRSTYDRSGGNETADAAHFLYQVAEDFNVSLDVEGPGVVYFARYNHWHGSPWHYEVDGTDHLVQETTTANPLQKLADSVFLPEDLFPTPLTWTYATTKGADLMWVPIPFERRFRMAYSRTFYGTGYYIYHQFVRGVPLSQPIRAWDGKTPPSRDVLDLLNRSGTDIAPRPGAPQAEHLGVRQRSGSVNLPADGVVTLARLTDAPAMLRRLELSVPRDQAIRFGRARLRVTWDDRTSPSIDAPVALFFGTGTLYNRDNKEHLVKAFPVNVRFDRNRVYLACYFPMPFFQSAKFELIETEGSTIPDVRWSLRFHPFSDPPQWVGYFHATYRDHGEPELGRDLVFLDTRGLEGSDVWSGNFVGTSFIFTDRAVLNTLEGDPRFFFDDSQTPQAYGTGTEEWGGGGDYWGGRTMTLPLAGHPVGVARGQKPQCDEDLIHSAYRFLLADLMPFGRRAVIRFEHGGVNQSVEHYRSVTYWYGAPAASLVKTDELDVGNVAGEQAHEYRSADGSAPDTITSRYEWGPDHATRRTNAKQAGSQAKSTAVLEIFPAHTQVGRVTKKASEFTVNVRPDNQGVLLRRTLDYQYTNQRARVFVAHADATRADWKEAGVWYLAGSNTCYHSYPRKAGELGKTAPVVQTSNRRFRDDEFLIPRDLTKGQARLRLRVEFAPVAIPLLPGRAVGELAWSEIRYQVFSYTLPHWSPEGS